MIDSGSRQVRTIVSEGALLPGSLVVLEGPDGVGKSTVAKGLVARLKGSRPVRLLAFPGNMPGSLGYHVYQIHHEPSVAGLSKISPAAVQALHLAAHLDAIEQIILPALKAGEIVVLDRYWWSMWVYGLVGGVSKDLLSSLVQTERNAWEGVLPAVVLLLRSPASHRPNAHRDWSTLCEAYDDLARVEASHHPVVMIENDRDVAAAIRKVCYEAKIATKARSAQEVLPLFARSQPDPASQSPQQPREPRTPNVGPARTSVVYDSYWEFACKRQDVFFRRLRGDVTPWTTDPILLRHKFTNAYRAADRVSQFLIRHVLYSGSQEPEEVFFRAMLFKLFNRVDTWQCLEKNFGSISWRDYDFRRYHSVLDEAMEAGARIYSAAYIMPSPKFGYPRKHQNHLKLIERMMADGLPTRLATVGKMREAFELLRGYPSLGDFLAYQFTIDLNYSALMDHDEDEFIVPGPGARDGIRKCFSDFGGLSEADLIRQVTRRQEEEFERRGLVFQTLFGRRLHLIDCQNLFCEVDKYARVAHPEVRGLSGRDRIKQVFRPTHEPIEYWFPPKWKINQNIPSTRKSP